MVQGGSAGMSPLIRSVGGGLGCVWILLGVLKAAAPESFIRHTKGELALGPQVGTWAAWLVITFEFCLGVALSWQFWRGTWRAGPATLSLVLATSMVAYQLALGSPTQDCGCFGAAVAASYWRRVTVAGTLLFASCTILQSIAPRRPTASNGTIWK